MRGLWLGMTIWLAAAPVRAQDAAPTFGVTVVDPFGLKGEIYLIHEGSRKLPNFDKLEPVGAIYASSLNVAPRDFTDGFPGVTRRFEWFAIDYSGRFWVEKPDQYRFSLGSDDGSRLYIDGRQVINNDGIHPLQTVVKSVRLSGGIHQIRVSYFQGPRFHVALMLRIAGPDEEFRVFSTEEFRPPRNPDEWKFGNPADLKDPNEGRRRLKDVVRQKK
jgi:PA14 domain-containing protein